MVESCQGTKETMDMKNMVYGFRSKADMQEVANKDAMNTQQQTALPELTCIVVVAHVS